VSCLVLLQCGGNTFIDMPRPRTRLSPMKSLEMP
jgi:hypothetical protein